MTAASLSQSHFRWRRDSDLVDNTPTWGAAIDTNFTQSTNTPFRVRFCIQDTTTGTPTASMTVKLQCNKNGGTFQDVTTSSTIVKAVDAGGSADETTIATNLLGGTGTYTAGVYIEDGSSSTGVSMAGSGNTEYEFGIQINTADVADGDTITLKVVTLVGSTITATVIPSITARTIAYSGAFNSARLSHDPDMTPVRKSFLGRAAMAAALAGPIWVPFLIDGTNDQPQEAKWHVMPPDMTSNVKRQRSAAKVAIEAGAVWNPATIETITEDKWHHQQPDLTARQWRAKASKVAIEAGPLWAPYSPTGTGNVAFGDVYGAMQFTKTIIYDDLAQPIPVASTTVPYAASTFTSVRVAKTIIYDDLTYAPFVAAAENITPDKWWAEPQQPTRLRRKPHEQLVIAPTQPTASDQIGWYRDLELPVRLKKSYQGEFAFSPTQPTASDQIGWFSALSEPVRLKKKPHEQFAFGTDQPEQNDQIGWFRHLELPVRPKRKPDEGFLAFGTTQPTASDGIGWFRHLELPTRRKLSYEGLFVYPYQSIAATGGGTGDGLTFDVITSMRLDKTIIYDDFTWCPQPIAAALVPYAASTNTVVRVAKTIIFDDLTYAPFAPAAETITLDKWWAPLAEPVRLKKKPHEQFAFGTTQPTASDGIGWYVSLQEPPRRRAGASEGYFAFSATQPAQNDQIGWYAPLGLPTPIRRLVEYPAYQGATYFVPSAPGQGNEFDWWPHNPEFTRRARAIQIGQQQALAFVGVIPAENVKLDWFAELQQPTRRKAGVPVYEPLTAAQFVETVTLDKYFNPLETPTRLKKAYEGYLAFTPTQPTAGDQMGWWMPLGLPTARTRRHPETFQQPVYVIVAGPETWGQPLSEPTRRKVSVANYPVIPPTAVLVPPPSFGWFNKLDEPTRHRILRGFTYPDLFFNYASIPNVISAARCSHTLILYPTANGLVLYPVANAQTIYPTVVSETIYPTADGEVIWPSANTNIHTCKDN